VPVEFGEALRSIRTNILSRPTVARQNTLVVTSTTRGEGKTVVATNLALALTRANQRVLLVDGDMRRPRLHEIFRLSRTPGLSDLIQNPGRAAEVAKQTSVAGLKVITAGSETVNPADLLGLEPVTGLFDPAGNHYDWILIDSPPVREVTDACLLARGAGARVLFVLAADRVTQRAARSAVGRLQEVEAGFAGAVLSRVNVRRGEYAYY
jgi:capsular exopolysaccharide synthesis family protein